MVDNMGVGNMNGGGSPFFKENGNYQATHAINMGFKKILNLPDPTQATQAVNKQEDQDGPGSLTLFFEIALAIFFRRFQRRIYKNFFLCLYSARSLHSLIPCLLTDQNFKNNSEKGHLRNISLRLFQNLTNSF